MNASKENAREALRLLNDELKIEDRGTSPENDAVAARDFAFVRVFLEAAERKLPSEASFAKGGKRALKKK